MDDIYHATRTEVSVFVMLGMSPTVKEMSVTVEEMSATVEKLNICSRKVYRGDFNSEMITFEGTWSNM